MKDQAHVEEELEKVRAERDALRAQLENENPGRGPGHKGRGRRLTTAILVFMSGLLIAVSLTVGWAHRFVLDTDKWVETVAPIGDDPEITDALAARSTQELLEVIDVQAIAAEALPEQAAVLSVPLAGAVSDYVGEQVQAVLRSDAFARIWAEANRFAHARAVAVLRNESDVVDTTGGRVTLNLLPLINDALARIESRASDLLGRDISIPEISSGELPETARAKLEDALGRDLPDDFGEVVVFESDKLAAAQDAVATFDKLFVLFLILTPLLIVAALWLSRDRRRSLMQIATVAFVAMVIIRRIVITGQEAVVDAVKAENRGAARALVDHVFTNFFSVGTLILWGLALIIAVAFFTGPAPIAVRFRSFVRSASSAIGRSASARAGDEDTRRWVGAHRDALQIGGAVLAVLLILIFDLSWLAFLLIVGLLVLYELAIVRMAAGRAPPGPSATA